MKCLQIVFILFIQSISSQNIKVVYEHTFMRGKLKNDVLLYANDTIVQFICDIKQKNIDIDEIQVQQPAHYFVNTYYTKSNKSTEQTKFKDKIIYAEWNYDYGWTITDETSNILGYKVIKAYANSEDNDDIIYAWFTPDIPVSGGPIRYNGLPGLILSVSYKKLNAPIIAKEISMDFDYMFLQLDSSAVSVKKETMVNYDLNEMSRAVKKSSKL